MSFHRKNNPIHETNQFSSYCIYYVIPTTNKTEIIIYSIGVIHLYYRVNLLRGFNKVGNVIHCFFFKRIPYNIILCYEL